MKIFHILPTLFCILFSFSVAQAQGIARELREDVLDSLTVVDVVLECHNKTRDHIILRELALKEGVKVHRRDLPEILKKEKNKIFNTNLFTKVEVFHQELKNNELIIIVSVNEQWYLWPVPIIELADRNFNEWWTQRNRDLGRLEYGIRFRQRNFRGRNEDLKLLFQLGFTRKMELLYQIPYIDRRQKTGLGFQVLYTENTNSPFRTFKNRLDFIDGGDEVLARRFNFATSLRHRGAFYNTHSLNLRYAYEWVGDSVKEQTPEFFQNRTPERQYFSLEYRFFRDFRDIAAYPLKGWYLMLGATQRGFGLLDSHPTTSLTPNFARFFKLSPRWYFAMKTSGKLSFPLRQSYTDLRSLGYGQEVMRGYELYVIDGQHYLLGKSTLRFKLFENELNLGKLFPLDQFNRIPLAGFLKAYADAGRTWQLGDLPLLVDERFGNRALWSAGVGFDLVTYYNMVARFEYSYNPYDQWGFFFNLKAEF